MAAISGDVGRLSPLNAMTDVRLITFNSPIFESVAVITSVRPSAKFSSASPLAKLSNGRTAIDFDGMALKSTPPLGLRKNAATTASTTAAAAANSNGDLLLAKRPDASTLPWLMPTGSPSLVTQNTSNPISMPLSLGKPMLCVYKSA